jgi:lipoprotein signal peptidase
VVDPAAAASPAAVPAPEAGPKGFGGKPWFWWPWPFLVALDLWSKHAVFAFLEQVATDKGYAHVPENARPGHPVFGGALSFDLVTWGNTGTIWGLGKDSTIPLMVLRCGAVLGLFWFVRSTPRTWRLQQLVLSLILAGAIGNLYDNFVRADRSVRDFLFFHGTWPTEWTFPAFNVADSCITVGAFGLLLLLWSSDKAAKQTARRAEPGAPVS